jgi:hypothetical protein
VTAEIPVLVAGQRRRLTLDGVAYTVRALSYAEHSALLVEAAAAMPPSQADLEDALADLAEQAGRADLVAGIAALREAQDRAVALVAATPPALDSEGQVRWAMETKAERMAAEMEYRPAARIYDRALREFAGHERIVAMRRAMMDGERMAAVRLVAAALDGVGDKADVFSAEQVGMLPSGHVAALAKVAAELLAPGMDAAKN